MKPAALLPLIAAASLANVDPRVWRAIRSEPTLYPPKPRRVRDDKWRKSWTGETKKETTNG